MKKIPVKRRISFILHPSSFILLLLLPGCITPRQSAHRPTDIDPKEATADFWMAKPSVASAVSTDFNRLWDAAERAARFHRFELDQTDQRTGAITTIPLLSKQIWEVWRNDMPHLKDQVRASLAEYRQIVRFDFQRLPTGTYRLIPRVVIERHAEKEHRVTAAASYQYLFYNNPDRVHDYSIDQPVIAADYWYATGRDYGLERALAHDIQHRVDRQ